MITSSHEGCWGQVIFCSCVEISTHSDSRCLPRLAVSHGGGKLIELRSPRHGVSRRHCADQINVQVSRACRQASVQSAPRVSPRQPEPFLTAASTPQNLTSGRRLSRLAPKFLILEVIGLERAEPIFITASCSQDVMRFARRDPARVSFPRGWRGSPLTLRAGSGRFEHSPLRHFSLCHVAPEGD